MALLEDPTIQRILDEVNKAASGGVLGSAGNYIPEPSEPLAQFPSHPSFSENHYYNQDQAPLFYPTPDMFNMNDMTNFNNSMNFDPLSTMISMPTSSNFDLYTTGLYNTLPQAYISPYENYGGTPESNVKHQVLNRTKNPRRSTSSISSINNDLITEAHRHQEYPTVPPTITSAMPNLGLNIRTTPSQMDSISSNLPDPTDLQLINEDILRETAATTPISPSKNSFVDADVNGSSPLVDSEAIEQENSAAGKIFYDPNPQVIQRKGPHSVTYKQNIIVRFLQPPPVSHAAPLLIKEVRPPPPPSLPPLVIKQRPTPPKTPPPLIIREKPPPLPSSLATKVITRQLPPEPAPPRAVIIERLPPLPPKPRDIIIERWLPYEVLNQKRKVIVQHAPKPSKEQPQTKNVIITYEPVHAKIVRNFQKQHVVREDPQVYANRYASELYDANLVIQQARAAGVIEDLNPPVTIVSNTTNNVAIGTDYDLPPPLASSPTIIAATTVDVHDGEQRQADSNETADINSNQILQQEEEIMQATSQSPLQTNENLQEEDIFVEENVTPFYMNSGENIQQTLHRLGIDLPENLINEHHF